MTQPVPVSQLGRAVSRGVAAYKRKCSWAEEAELRQEAWLAAIESTRTWKPDRGPLEPYAMRAVMIMLGKWTIKSLCPVSAPDKSADRKAVIHLRSCSLDTDKENRVLASPEAPVDTTLAGARRTHAMRRRLRELASENAEAFGALLGNRSGSGSSRWGQRLEEQAVDMFLRMRHDPVLRQLWEDQ